MITDQFYEEKGIIDPWVYYVNKGKTLDVCLITFSHKVYECAANMDGSYVLGKLSAAMGEIPILKLPVKEKRVGVFLSPPGAPAAGGLMEDIAALTGVKDFILFGSAGTLDNENTLGRYIIPQKAYRDEGMSYHYLPPSDYVDIVKWSVVRDFFEKNNIPYVLGNTWTTDAMYRETRSALNKRKEEGCISVEMEIAGCQAVAIYKGFNLYAFLEAGDNLDGEEWSIGDLRGANHNKGKLFLAMEIAKTL